MIICFGCSKKNKVYFNSAPYTIETAQKNDDVIRTNNGTSYNTEKLDKFLENVKNGTNGKVRITQYTTEGGAILVDLSYDGKKITYTIDTTRDGFGAKTIEKKKFNSIYKDNSGYHLKNSSEDIGIF